MAEGFSLSALHAIFYVELCPGHRPSQPHQNSYHFERKILSAEADPKPDTTSLIYRHESIDSVTQSYLPRHLLTRSIPSLHRRSPLSGRSTRHPQVGGQRSPVGGCEWLEDAALVGRAGHPEDPNGLWQRTSCPGLSKRDQEQDLHGQGRKRDTVRLAFGLTDGNSQEDGERGGDDVVHR